MDQTTSSAVIAALNDAPIIVWRLSAAQVVQLARQDSATLPQDAPEVMVGGQYLARFAQAERRVWQALASACRGVATTQSCEDAAYAYHTHYQPRRDAQTRITGAWAVTTLVPKEPDAAMRTPSHEDLWRLLQHAPMAVCLMRPEGDDWRILFANPSYEALLDCGSLAGKSAAALLAGYTPPHAPMAQSLKGVLASAADKTVSERSVAHLDSRGERFFDIIYEPVLGADGKIHALSTFAYDVTAQIEAHRTLQASQDQLHKLADSMPQIVWSTDTKGTVQYYNKRWYAYTGFDSEHDAANSWQKLCHPNDVDIAHKTWQAALNTGAPLTYEGRIFDRQTHHYRWFLHRALPLHDARGQVVQWFGSSTDIDEHKRGRDQVDDVIETMNDAFFAVDANWVITRVNAKHERVTNISRTDQLGKNLLELYFSYPEANTSKYWVNYHKAMHERIAVSFDDYYERLCLWTDVDVYPAADGGLAVFFRDSTKERGLMQRLKVEKLKFEAIFVDSPACMALLRGPTFIFEKVNDRYAELLAHRDLLNKPFEAALPEFVGQPFKALMQKVMDTGQAYRANEMAVRLSGMHGQPSQDCFFDFTYSRVDDATGNPYGIYIHATDITERVLVRRKTEKLADSLTSAVHARDEFLSIASHELKTPVTSLKMQLQMTRRAVNPDENKAPLPTKLAKTLDLCCRQVDRLTALIEDLLDVSRVESGKMSFHFERVELSRLIDEVVDRFGEQLKTAGCTIETHYTEEMWVACDGFRIEQVVTNLLSNAMKYGAGTPVHIQASKGPKNVARIVVRDEGMGIAQDKQAKVFDRFERAISHNNVSGLGLGLYISKQIVEAHHGHISVQSELGCGSTFTVELPQDASVGQSAATQKAG